MDTCVLFITCASFRIRRKHVAKEKKTVKIVRAFWKLYYVMMFINILF